MTAGTVRNCSAIDFNRAEGFANVLTNAALLAIPHCSDVELPSAGPRLFSSPIPMSATGPIASL